MRSQPATRLLHAILLSVLAACGSDLDEDADISPSEDAPLAQTFPAEVRFTGSGCAPGTSSYSVDSAGTTYTFRLPKLLAASNAADVNATTNCVISIRPTVSNVAFAVRSVEFQGPVELPAGGRAQVNLETHPQGSGGRSAREEPTQPGTYPSFVARLDVPLGPDDYRFNTVHLVNARVQARSARVGGDSGRVTVKLAALR